MDAPIAAAEALIVDVAVAALGSWLSNPGSDVEKYLKKAMRARHDELDQASRKTIADSVLGATVLHGRLVHLLRRQAASTEDAGNILALFVLRERGGKFRFPCAERAAVEAAARMSLYQPEDRPSVAERLAVVWSLPLWLASRWTEELGAVVAFRLARSMVEPGTPTLRANTLKTSRLALLTAINAVGVRAVPTSESPWGIRLPDGRPPGGGVWHLPGWSDGWCELQDEGSQLITLATEAQPGEAVVDYCAGRGGKTWALASLVGPSGSVRAWDIEDDLRLQLRGARADRAGAASIVQAPDERPQEAHADVVLVDAPCSSCGALRRHPSQRWAISESDVASIAKVQAAILREASLLVRPGGRLVYATCSLLREENGAVADAFQAKQLDFEPWPFSFKHAVSGQPAHHRLLMPHVDGTDGFFIARWKRRT